MRANNAYINDKYDVRWQKSLLDAMYFELNLHTQRYIQMKFDRIKLNFNIVSISRILFSYYNVH